MHLSQKFYWCIKCVCVYEISLLNKYRLGKWVYLVLKSNAGSIVMEAIRTTCLISRAIILNFSKFTRPSTLELLPVSTQVWWIHTTFLNQIPNYWATGRKRCKLPSWRKVRSFLTTGNRGMTGGCRLCLLRRLRYLAILREGSKTSCNSARSFSYFPGNRSHVDLNRETGDRLNPLQKIHRYTWHCIIERRWTTPSISRNKLKHFQGKKHTDIFVS